MYIFIKIRQNLISIITTGKYKLNEQLAIHGKCVVITNKTQAYNSRPKHGCVQHANTQEHTLIKINNT